MEGELHGGSRNEELHAGSMKGELHASSMIDGLHVQQHDGKAACVVASASVLTCG
jgi:hypothetical protein